jgi:hypothetical protein
VPDTNAVDLKASSNGDRLYYMVDGTQKSIKL